jgi:hypothetical protein
VPLPAAALALALAAGESAPRCVSLDLSLAGIGSLEEDLARTAGLAGAAPLRTGLVRRPSGARPLRICDGEAPGELPDPEPPPGLEWAVVPPASLTKLHTSWADDRNDGALWAGRGVSSVVSTGLRARWRWITAQLAPLAAWQQNRGFFAPASTASGQSPYANPFNGGRIDLPLRMGPSAFWTLDWGQSYLRADAFGLAVGLSNENLWWGPGIRSSLLMTDSGPGFPHLFAGTSRPLDAWVGRVELELLWGQLRESRYFDSDRSNDRRLFEALVATFSPAFPRGLALGYARVFLFPRASPAAHHYLDPLWQPFLEGLPRRGGSSPGDQLLSLFFRWAFPEEQLEFYGEWARDDAARGGTDLVMDPGHSQAFSLGLQKLFPAGRRWVRFQIEMTHTVEVPPASPARIAPVFYAGDAAPQGYTHRGQMLGAGLGPQGDSEIAAIDWYHGPGRVGLFVERILRNERYYHDSGQSLGNILGHDLEMSYGLRGSHALREWDLEWELAFSHRYAVNLGPLLNGVDATVSVRWWPGRSEAPVLPAPLPASPR